MDPYHEAWDEGFPSETMHMSQPWALMQTSTTTNDKGDHVVRTRLPFGVEQDDIHLDFEEGGLRLSASKSHQEEQKKHGSWHKSQVSVSHYWPLSDDVKPEDIEAHFDSDEGVLEIVLPHGKSGHRTKSMPISIGGASKSHKSFDQDKSAKDIISEKGSEYMQRAKDKASEYMPERGRERGYQMMDRARETGEDMAEKGAEYAKDAKDKGSEYARDAKEKGYEYADKAREKGADLMERAKEKGSDVMEKGSEMVEKAKEKGSEFVEKAKDTLASGAEKAKDTLASGAESLGLKEPTAQNVPSSTSAMNSRGGPSPRKAGSSTPLSGVHPGSNPGLNPGSNSNLYGGGYFSSATGPQRSEQTDKKEPKETRDTKEAKDTKGKNPLDSPQMPSIDEM